MPNHKYINNNTILLISLFILSLIFWGPMIYGVWGPSDDHEIINFLGTDRSLFFHEIFKLFIESEAWLGFSDLRPRFRPNFYFLRIIETFLFEDNLILWYFFRILLFYFFITSLFFFIKKYFGTSLSIIFILIELLFPYWADMVTRLGIAESYSLFGISLIMNSYTFNKSLSNNLCIFLMCLGVFLCVGIKENFIYFSLLPLLTIIFKRHLMSLTGLIFCIITLLFSLYIAVGIFMVLYLNQGLDEYNQSLLSRFSFFKNIFSPFFIFWTTTIILFIWSKRNYFFVKNLIPNPKIILLKNKIIFIFFSYMVYIFTFFFFAGNFPNGTRYDFPALIISHLTFLIIISEINSFSFIFNQKKLIVILIILLTLGNIVIHRHESLKAIFRQQNFMSTIEAANNYLKLHPDHPLIIKSYCGGTEHATSVFSLLRVYFNHDNDIMLLIDGNKNESCGGGDIKYELNQEMLRIQDYGDDQYSKFIDLKSNCFSIGLDGPYYNNCEGAIFYRKRGSDFNKYKINSLDILSGKIN